MSGCGMEEDRMRPGSFPSVVYPCPIWCQLEPNHPKTRASVFLPGEMIIEQIGGRQCVTRKLTWERTWWVPHLLYYRSFSHPPSFSMHALALTLSFRHMISSRRCLGFPWF